MKHLNKLLGIFVVILLMSCGNGRNATTTNDTRTTGSTTANTTMDTRADGTMYQPSSYELERRQQIYSSLNLTQDQIKRYETDSRKYMDTWRTNNAQRTMNNQEQMDYEMNTLKPILNSSQYSSYQTWITSNPYRN